MLPDQERTDEELTPPETSGGDHAHAVTRAGLSSIPLVGGAAAELFSALVTPPLEARLEGWRETVGEALQTIDEPRAPDL